MKPVFEERLAQAPWIAHVRISEYFRGFQPRGFINYYFHENVGLEELERGGRPIRLHFDEQETDDDLNERTFHIKAPDGKSYLFASLVARYTPIARNGMPLGSERLRHTMLLERLVNTKPCVLRCRNGRYALPAGKSDAAVRLTGVPQDQLLLEPVLAYVGQHDHFLSEFYDWVKERLQQSS